MRDFTNLRMARPWTLGIKGLMSSRAACTSPSSLAVWLSRRSSVVKMERQLVVLRQELQAAEQRASEVAQQEKKKLEKAAEREEESRNMSEAGAMQLVSIRLSYQESFDNSSDKADKIWEHIHDDFMKRVDDGNLPPGDGRSQTALEKRFTTELGEFRLWAATANRAIELSGVPADEVEEKVRAHYRPTTNLFIKAGYFLRPDPLAGAAKMWGHVQKLKPSKPRSSKPGQQQQQHRRQ